MNRLRESLSLAWPLVAAKLALQLACANGYGYFRDELYYLACARHLDWGYVDHPMLSVALLAGVHRALGDSRLALRLLPALAGAALVLVTAVIARQMGGGRTAQRLAALAVLIAPELLALHHIYSMNAFEPLLWAVAVAVLVPILTGEAEATGRRWAALGVLLGLGIENKLSMLWLIGGLGAGLVATRQRRLLVTRGPWLALAIALALAAPYAIWEAAHGYPTAEFVRNATQEKMARISPGSFLLAQVGNMHPLNVLLWLPGVVALLAWRRLEAVRALGVAFVAILALLLMQRGARTGYLVPAFPMVLAAGAVVVEALTRRTRAVPVAFAALLGIGGAVTAPFALPLLPVERYLGYARALHQAPSTEEKKEVGALPQFYADMFGWPEMTDAVLRVVETLTPEERERAVVLTSNYGQAGAFELLGRGRGMPVVASGHNNYWLWGPGRADADVVIRLRRPEELPRLREQFEVVEERGRFDHPLNMPYESGLVLVVARHPRVPLGASWPERKHFD